MGREDEIRLIAYSIWEEEGCLDGQDCKHWYRAEEIWENRQALDAAATQKRESNVAKKMKIARQKAASKKS